MARLRRIPARRRKSGARMMQNGPVRPTATAVAPSAAPWRGPCGSAEMRSSTRAAARTHWRLTTFSSTSCVSGTSTTARAHAPTALGSGQRRERVAAQTASVARLAQATKIAGAAAGSNASAKAAISRSTLWRYPLYGRASARHPITWARS